ncbi:abasic site processing protein HMCES [Sitodiplosis mosellana]|uniref:abasic site processing protein HMCES n=1 Tax=Sitodiplosis mosellana TaxID=263140 RepID=UPI002444E169|nr:abasic site processing protein HMCES [Sitodiplosis mosellana]
MCGRSCLTLEPDEIRKATAYKSPTKSEDKPAKWKQPEWRNEYNCDREYKPSHNIAPTDISPVLISAAHFESDEDDVCQNFPELQGVESDKKEEPIDSLDQVLVPMLWGMIPFWHNPSLDYRKHGLTTNNCRLESMLESKLYRHAFNKGQRCVILCEGFYEWQTTDPNATKPSQRAAYYIYMPQPEGVQIEVEETWRESMENMKLLKMAGLFDIWINAQGEQLYSYTVITFESDDTLGWLHHRSPAILDSDEAVADWIDFKRVTDTKYLISLLKPAKNLQWHRVSNIVNNARNKSDQCNKRIENVEKDHTPKSPLMKSWLIRK